MSVLATLKRPKRRKSSSATTPAPAVPAATNGEGAATSLEELTKKYGLPPADELGGPDSSRVFFDYGAPVVLADSSEDADRKDLQADLWARALER